MKTINQTLPRAGNNLQHWLQWSNSVMTRLDRLMTTGRRIDVNVIHTEYTTDNGHMWECQHINQWREYVTVGYDGSELLTVCDDCDAQLIGEEWIDEK